MGTVLFTKLGLKIPESEGDFDYTLDSLDRALTLDGALEGGAVSLACSCGAELVRPAPLPTDCEGTGAGPGGARPPSGSAL